MGAGAVGCSCLPPFLLGNIIKFDAGMPYSLLGAFGGGFRWGKNVFNVWYNNKNLSHPFPHHWGAGRGGFEQVQLDEAACHLPYWETSPNLVLGCHCWAQLVAVLGGVKLYYGSSIIIKIYPTLSAATGGWDGVDQADALQCDSFAPSFLGNIIRFGFSEERWIQ